MDSPLKRELSEPMDRVEPDLGTAAFEVNLSLFDTSV